MIDNDLKWIKKHYGENMMRLCRTLFPKILQHEGSLPEILKKHFEYNKHLADDIINNKIIPEFVVYISSFVDDDSKILRTKAKKSAVELMKDAGYILYPECKTENDIQAFRKWYAEKELLCTFMTDRLESCRVWFAVKENAEEIKRENFPNPKRQDEYGTSVISIQFQKSIYGTLSIKNRYNHTVNCCDSTFDNNLENIIPGLTEAFENDYGAVDRTFDYGKTIAFELPNYVCVNNKYYYYNIKINDTYYCRNNSVLKLYEIIKLPEHRMLVDYFVFDLKNKTVELYNKNYNDYFVDSLGIIKNLTFKDNTFYIERECGETVEVGINDDREIISIKYNDLTICGDAFLSKNRKIRKIEMQKLVVCGDYFLSCNEDLKELSLPNLSRCGKSFVSANKTIENLEIPKLESCGSDFLQENKAVAEIDFPDLSRCGNNFFRNNVLMKKANLPNIGAVGDSFMLGNKGIKEINFPKLKYCGDSFLGKNENIGNAFLPKLQLCGKSFLFLNMHIKTINLPKLKKCGDSFMSRNKDLAKVYLPELEECGDRFLMTDLKLKELSLPKLRRCGDSFLKYNVILKSINISNLTKAGRFFLHRNTKLRNLKVPNINGVDICYLEENPKAASDLMYYLQNNITKEEEIPSIDYDFQKLQ